MKKDKKISDLKAAEYNPRKINKEQLDMLKKAMKKFGDLSGIVFNRKTGNLIGGHQRVKIFDPSWLIKTKAIEPADAVGTVAKGTIKSPYGDWSYREVDWPKEKEKAANIAANQHGGEWVEELRDDMLLELDSLPDFNIELTGFDDKDITKIKKRRADLSGGGGSDDIDEQYSILVECADETEQRKLMEKFEKDKIKCKPIVL